MNNLNKDVNTKQPKVRYAPRGEERTKLALVLPTRQVKYLRRIADKTHTSLSSVTAEHIDEAIGKAS